MYWTGDNLSPVVSYPEDDSWGKSCQLHYDKSGNKCIEHEYIIPILKVGKSWVQVFVKMPMLGFLGCPFFGGNNFLRMPILNLQHSDSNFSDSNSYPGILTFGRNYFWKSRGKIGKGWCKSVILSGSQTSRARNSPDRKQFAKCRVFVVEDSPLLVLLNCAPCTLLYSRQPQGRRNKTRHSIHSPIAYALWNFVFCNSWNMNNYGFWSTYAVFPRDSWSLNTPHRQIESITQIRSKKKQRKQKIHRIPKWVKILVFKLETRSFVFITIINPSYAKFKS